MGPANSGAIGGRPGRALHGTHAGRKLTSRRLPGGTLKHLAKVVIFDNGNDLDC